MTHDLVTLGGDLRPASPRSAWPQRVCGWRSLPGAALVGEYRTGERMSAYAEKGRYAVIFKVLTDAAARSAECDRGEQLIDSKHADRYVRPGRWKPR